MPKTKSSIWKCAECGKNYDFFGGKSIPKLQCSCGHDKFVRPDDFIDPSLKWGTYGKSGKEKIKYLEIKECGTEHLFNILKDQLQISNRYKKTIEHVLLKKEMGAIRKIVRNDIPLHINDTYYTEEARTFLKKRISLGI